MKTFIRRLILVSVVLYLFGTLFGGIGLGWIALHPPRHLITPGETADAWAFATAQSAEFKDTSITRPQGVVLRAWFLKPESGNGDAVILLHGVSDNRMGMYGYGKWLLSKKYMVLLPDARSHGLGGGLASYGLKESEDIHLWMNWIEQAYHPRCVYALGESMGAAQLLQALAKENRFCAVVGESPFASFREVAYARFGGEFHTGPWIGETFFRPTVEVGLLFVRVRYGLDMERASPKEAVEKAETPILLIHGLSDRNIPPCHADEIRTHNPAEVVVWKVPEAAHTRAHQVAPVEFESKVLGWFESHPPH